MLQHNWSQHLSDGHLKKRSQTPVHAVSRIKNPSNLGYVLAKVLLPRNKNLGEPVLDTCDVYDPGFTVLEPDGQDLVAVDFGRCEGAVGEGDGDAKWRFLEYDGAFVEFGASFDKTSGLA